MSKVKHWLDRRLYPDFGDYWDDRMFRDNLLGWLDTTSQVLDFGCGVGGLRDIFDFRDRAGKVAGVDVDPAAKSNPFLHDFRLIESDGRIPYPDETFDLVYSVNVLEHVRDPESCFREVRRVLKSGGRFMAKTPNFWHYVPLIASMTPNSFHIFINRVRGRSDEHTFPTAYRCNTPGAIERLSSRAGFNLRELQLVEGRPEYLRFAPPYTLPVGSTNDASTSCPVYHAFAAS